MSPMVRTPDSTRLLTGQDTNEALGSTRITLVWPPENLRMYFAAVAPP